MSDITINKQVKGDPFNGQVFFCKDCGEEVRRKGASHKRCKDCARDNTLNILNSRLRRHFPVIDESWEWIAIHLLERDDTEYKRHYDREKRSDERKEKETPIPCDTCSLRQKCEDELLMCRQYHQYTESELKNPPMEVGRRDPKRYYYLKSFNNKGE